MLNKNEKLTKDVDNIVSSGKLRIGCKEIDISAELDRTNKKSIEYRAEEMQKIKGRLENSENIVEIESVGGRKECNIEVKPIGSLDVRNNCGKIGILNFASSKNPGGGFLTGAMAQEESICYRSNLYYVLREHVGFYEYNRRNLKDGLYTDGIIFSEDVLVFKTNTHNNIKPAFVNIITCAAPNRGVALKRGVTESEIRETMARRLEQIMLVAIENGVEHLVLGAFGCGVFKNDPTFVAEETKKLLFDKGYSKYFNKVTFPLLNKKGENFSAFMNTFNM